MCVQACGSNFRTQHSYIGSVVDSILKYFAFHVADLGSRPEPGLCHFYQSSENVSNTGFSVGGNKMAALFTCFYFQNSCCAMEKVKTEIFKKLFLPCSGGELATLCLLI